MVVYGTMTQKDELKALSLIAKAERKGLANCSERMMSKVEKAVTLLAGRGYIIDIQ